jgi:hypothetical protein
LCEGGKSKHGFEVEGEIKRQQPHRQIRHTSMLTSSSLLHHRRTEKRLFSVCVVVLVLVLVLVYYFTVPGLLRGFANTTTAATSATTSFN